MTEGSPSTTARTETTTLQIVVPADPRVLRVLRLVASGVASLGEFDLDANGSFAWTPSPDRLRAVRLGNALALDLDLEPYEVRLFQLAP